MNRKVNLRRPGLIYAALKLWAYAGFSIPLMAPTWYAATHLEGVIADECTGCDLCVEPCPVDCIDMIPVQTSLKDWGWQMPKPAKGPHIIATDKTGLQDNAA